MVFKALDPVLASLSKVNENFSDRITEPVQPWYAWKQLLSTWAICCLALQYLLRVRGAHYKSTGSQEQGVQPGVFFLSKCEEDSSVRIALSATVILKTSLIVALC